MSFLHSLMPSWLATRGDQSRSPSPAIHSAPHIQSSTHHDTPISPEYSVGRVAPPEIDDYLMSTLTNDPATLKTCGLVCRAWLAASRVYLFRDVTIETEEQFSRFEELIQSSPMICSCVRNLRLDRRNRKYELNFPWINTKLSRTLPMQLPRLNLLEMQAIDEKWRTSTFEHLSNFKQVTKVSIVKCAFSPEELFGIISAFSAMKELRVVDFVELFNGRDEPVRLMHKSQLERLTLLCDDIPARAFGGQSLIDFVMEHAGGENLRGLDIEVSKRNVGEVGRFIRRLPRLEELRLRLARLFGSYQNDLLDVLDNVNFAENFNLRCLTMGDPVHPATPTLLARIASPHIRTVAFAYDLYEVKSISQLDSELLERTLAAPNLQRLTQVKFLVRWDSTKLEGVEHTFRKTFALLDSQNILRVEHVEEW